MAWIQGKLEKTLTIAAPYEEVLAFFQDPAKFKEAFAQMKDSEQLEPNTWKWTLQEKQEKGIKFQGIYTVKYEPTADGCAWETLEGNIKSSGSSRVSDLGGGKASLAYEETLQTDLPIPRLMAKVFQPIVGREVSKGIGSFLENAQKILES